MFILDDADTLEAISSADSSLTVTVMGDEVTKATGANDYKVLYQGQPISTGTGSVLITVGAGKQQLIKSVHIANTTGTSKTFKLWAKGHTDTRVVLATTTIQAGYTMVYASDGWSTYDASGVRQAGIMGPPGPTGAGSSSIFDDVMSFAPVAKTVLNDAENTRSSAITGANMLTTDTSTTLVDASGMPNSNFFVFVDQEKMLVGTRTGNVLSGITRAVAGTLAQHNIGKVVKFLDGWSANAFANVLIDTTKFFQGTRSITSSIDMSLTNGTFFYDTGGIVWAGSDRIGLYAYWDANTALTTPSDALEWVVATGAGLTGTVKTFPINEGWAATTWTFFSFNTADLGFASIGSIGIRRISSVPAYTKSGFFTIKLDDVFLGGETELDAAVLSGSKVVVIPESAAFTGTARRVDVPDDAEVLDLRPGFARVMRADGSKNLRDWQLPSGNIMPDLSMIVGTMSPGDDLHIGPGQYQFDGTVPFAGKSDLRLFFHGAVMYQTVKINSPFFSITSAQRITFYGQGARTVCATANDPLPGGSLSSLTSNRFSRQDFVISPTLVTDPTDLSWVTVSSAVNTVTSLVTSPKAVPQGWGGIDVLAAHADTADRIARFATGTAGVPVEALTDYYTEASVQPVFSQLDHSTPIPRNCRIDVDWFATVAAGGGLISTTSTSVTPDIDQNTWVLVSGVHTSPSGAAFASPKLVVSAAGHATLRTYDAFNAAAPPTSGTYKLTYAGADSAAIAFNASATTGVSSVRALLEGIAGIGVGNVTVTGPDGGPYQITLAAGKTGTFTVTNINLSGGSLYHVSQLSLILKEGHVFAQPVFVRNTIRELKLGISAVTDLGGGAFRFTTTTNHFMIVGDTPTLSGFTTTAVNDVWTVTVNDSATQFTATRAGINAGANMTGTTRLATSGTKVLLAFPGDEVSLGAGAFRCYARDKDGNITVTFTADVTSGTPNADDLEVLLRDPKTTEILATQTFTPGTFGSPATMTLTHSLLSIFSRTNFSIRKRLAAPAATPTQVVRVYSMAETGANKYDAAFEGGSHFVCGSSYPHAEDISIHDWFAEGGGGCMINTGPYSKHVKLYRCTGRSQATQNISFSGGEDHMTVDCVCIGAGRSAIDLEPAKRYFPNKRIHLINTKCYVPATYAFANTPWPVCEDTFIDGLESIDPGSSAWAGGGRNAHLSNLVSRGMPGSGPDFDFTVLDGTIENVTFENSVSLRAATASYYTDDGDQLSVVAGNTTVSGLRMAGGGVPIISTLDPGYFIDDPFAIEYSGLIGTGGGLENTKTIGNSGSSCTLALARGVDGNVQTVTNTASCTYTMPSGLPVGKAISFTLIVTNNGPYTATFPGVMWDNGGTPVLTSGVSHTDIFNFLTFDGGATWYGFVAGQDMQ